VGGIFTRPRVADLIPRVQLRGAEIFAQHLEDALRDRFHTRLMPLYGKEADAQLLDVEHGPVDYAPGVADGPAHILRASRSLRRRIRDFNPHLVVAHGGEPLRIAVFARIHHVAPLLYRRVASVPPDLRTYGRLPSLRYAYRRARVVVAASESLRRELVDEFGIPAGRVRVIRNGRPRVAPLSTDERRAIRAELGVEDGDSLIVWVGRFVREKDPLAAVGLARNLHGRDVSARLAMVGRGPLFERAASESGGLPNLTMTGVRDDAPRLIAAADALVSTSVTEGAPGVFVEAALAGVPVVTYDQGGVRDIVVEGESGLLVPAGNLDALTEAVTTLVREPNTRRRLAEGAMRHSVRFDIAQVAEEWAALYSEIVAATKPA
jgi:glycosyltransferase involved in cell wall biosynthesis